MSINQPEDIVVSTTAMQYPDMFDPDMVSITGSSHSVGMLQRY